MKTRRKFIDKVKQHTKAIQITGVLMLLVIVFILGFFVSWNFMKIPLPDSQFELYEQVARDVYAQEGQVIVEVPEDVIVSKTTTTITVESASLRYRGKVIAKLKDGKLVMTQYLETGETVALSILMGIAFVCVFIILFMIADKIYKDIR